MTVHKAAIDVKHFDSKIKFFEPSKILLLQADLEAASIKAT